MLISVGGVIPSATDSRNDKSSACTAVAILLKECSRGCVGFRAMLHW